MHESVNVSNGPSIGLFHPEFSVHLWIFTSTHTFFPLNDLLQMNGMKCKRRQKLNQREKYSNKNLFFVPFIVLNQTNQDKSFIWAAAIVVDMSAVFWRFYSVCIFFHSFKFCLVECCALSKNQSLNCCVSKNRFWYMFHWSGIWLGLDFDSATKLNPVIPTLLAVQIYSVVQ